MKAKTKKVLWLISIVALVCLGAGYLGYRGYVSARQARLLKQARAFLAKPNPRKAYLTLQRALRYNPKDVDACRLMAELTERAGSSAALLYRSRVVEVEPHSLDDRLALALTAMRFHDYASATNALEGADAAGRKTAAYHNVAGTVAAQVNRVAEAEAHFLEASRLDPTNQVLQLNLAELRLRGTNAQSASEARAMLASIASSNSTLRCIALRALLFDAAASRQTNAALALSRELVQQTNSAFSDRLRRLDVLMGSQNSEFKPYLAAVQREAGTNAPSIFELGNWQMTRTGPVETLAWLRSLPRSLQTNQPVALFMAKCQTLELDWKGLQASLESQNWGDLELLRYAFKARALRGQNLAGAAKGDWELALKAANNQKANLRMLLEVAAQWNWQSEGEDLLWTIVNRYPEDKAAFQTLCQLLVSRGSTRPLMMLFSQELKRTPADLGIKNNLAMTALLLEASELKPHDLARALYQTAPTNASFASTYAFSLHLQKKDAEALKIMQQLSPRDLENPSIAGYYGLVLKATGDAAKARPYLEWAFKTRLLPEERHSLRAGKGRGLTVETRPRGRRTLKLCENSSTTR